MKNKTILSILLATSISQLSAIEFYQYTPEQDKNKQNIVEYNNISFLINEGKYERAKRDLKKIEKRMNKNEVIYENVLYQLGYVHMKLNEKNEAINYYEKVGKIKSAKQSYITLLSNWHLFQYTGEFKYLERNKNLYEIFKDYIVNEKEILVHINGDLLTNNFKEALAKYKRITKEKQNPKHLLILNLLNHNKLESKKIINDMRKNGIKNRELEKELAMYNLFLNLQGPESKEVKQEIRNMKKFAISRPDFNLNYRVDENMLERGFLQNQLKEDILSNIMKLNYIINDVRFLLNLDYKKELLKIKTEKEHNVLKRRIFAQEWFTENVNQDLYLKYEEYKKKLNLDDLNFQESFNLGLLNIKMGRYIESMPYLKKSFYLRPQEEYSAIILLIIDSVFKHNNQQRLSRLEKKQMIGKIEQTKQPFIKYLYEKMILKNDQEARKEISKIKSDIQKDIVLMLEQLRYTKNKRNLEKIDSFSRVLLTLISDTTQFEKIKIIQDYFLIKKRPILEYDDPTFITDIKIKLAYIAGVLKDTKVEYELFDKPAYLRGIALIKVFEEKYLEGKELLEKLTVDYNIKDINTNQMLLITYKKLGDTSEVETVLSDKNITKNMYKLFLLSKIKRTFENGDFETLEDLLLNPQYQKNTLLIIEPDFLVEKLLNKKNIIYKKKYLLKK